MTKQQQADRAQSIAFLRSILKPGDTIYTSLAHVSRSGMSRKIKAFVMTDNGYGKTEPTNVSWHVARVFGDRPQDHYGARVVKMDGCGTDMGFELVYTLGRYLFPEGFAVAGAGRNGDTSGHDNDGGYALKQRWL